MVRSFLLLGLLALAAGASSACTAEPVSPSAGVPFSTLDLRLGTGATTELGSVMTVNYTGWVYDASKLDNKGVPFDTSIGKQPFTFTLGGGQVIAGWETGLVNMRVGGVRRLVIPPSLAYGDTRSGAIPPNSTLVFEVELLSIG